MSEMRVDVDSARLFQDEKATKDGKEKSEKAYQHHKSDLMALTTYS
jgi:hypothetical protein